MAPQGVSKAGTGAGEVPSSPARSPEEREGAQPLPSPGAGEGHDLRVGARTYPPGARPRSGPGREQSHGARALSEPHGVRQPYWALPGHLESPREPTTRRTETAVSTLQGAGGLRPGSTWDVPCGAGSESLTRAPFHARITCEALRRAPSTPGTGRSECRGNES